MKSIAIFTHSNDNQSINDVSNHLKEANIDVIRFDTDLYPTQYLIDAEFSGSKTKHILKTPEGKLISTEELNAIWYRRFYTGFDIDTKMDPQLRAISVDESKTSVIGFLSCLDCFQLDSYWDVRRASVKDYQLKLASKMGFEIPNTLATNNIDNAKIFFHSQSGNVITKTQGSFGVQQDGIEHVMYTTDLDEQDLNDTNGLRQCPMTFQEKIKKALELRVTVVGNHVFCAAIDSSRHVETSTDWRKLSRETAEDWFKYTLPNNIKEKVIEFTKALNLNYGAIDILLTSDEEYIFLEINPCGEFYWLDQHVGYNICDTIAELLIDSC